MRRALVINCSAAHYNLGCAKLADWLRETGYAIEECAGDPGMFALGHELVCLSVIFSWHAPLAAVIANRVKSYAEVWCGGPAMHALGRNGWWKRETGLDCCQGLDARFERQRGRYKMTFASRGCPVNCWFCVVPKLEGAAFTLDWDFVPAPVLCDNNLSALPDNFQEHIIRRYQESGVILKDANSGFEPRYFTEAMYRRWKPVLKGPWRFAFDETKEWSDVCRTLRILEAEPPRRKQVYVLVGNEPVASCYERAMRVIQHGGEPYCQFFKPLNWLGGPLNYRYDWTKDRAIDFCRFFNRHLWRKLGLRDYVNRKGERPVFQGVLT